MAGMGVSLKLSNDFILPFWRLVVTSYDFSFVNYNRRYLLSAGRQAQYLFSFIYVTLASL